MTCTSAPVDSAGVASIVENERVDLTARARRLPSDGDGTVSPREFVDHLESETDRRVDDSPNADDEGPITRGGACRMIYQLVA